MEFILVSRLNQIILLLAVSFSGSFASAVENAEEGLLQLEAIGQLITDLNAGFSSATEARQRIVATRLRREEIHRIELLHGFAESVLEADRIDLSESQRVVLEQYLAAEPAQIRKGIARIIGQVELPVRGLTPQEVAAQATRLEDWLTASGVLHAALYRNLELSRLAGMDVEAESILLNESTRERAENASAYLDVVLGDARALAKEAALLPENLELQALHRVHRKLLSVVITELQDVIVSLQQLGQADTTRYRSQIVSASGSLSQDVFDLGVVSALLSGWIGNLSDWIGSNGISTLFNLLTFVLIVLVSRWLSVWVRRAVENALVMSKAKMSTLLRRMIVSTATSSVYVIGLLIAFSQVGFSLGPLLAGLGIAGFVIGFALQDTLSNFASGMMILFYRPFDVGDVIDSGGILGTVSEMSLVNTTILTFDNQTLIVPNSNIWGNVIKNVTAQRQRRVDLLFSIGYGDDIPRAESAIWDVLKDHDMVLEEPVPLVKIHELGESSVNIAVRPWVKTEDYWTVYWDLTRTIKMKFDETGITIPFPQRDVHIIREE